MQDSTPETKALIPPQSISVVRTESPSKKSKNDLFPRIAAALFYGIASFMIMVVNKHVLTIHKFPSFQVRFLKENTVELGYKSMLNRVNSGYGGHFAADQFFTEDAK